jgi:hypothetical protein
MFLSAALMSTTLGLAQHGSHSSYLVSQLKAEQEVHTVHQALLDAYAQGTDPAIIDLYFADTFVLIRDSGEKLSRQQTHDTVLTMVQWFLFSRENVHTGDLQLTMQANTATVNQVWPVYAVPAGNRPALTFRYAKQSGVWKLVSAQFFSPAKTTVTTTTGTSGE